MNLMVNNLSLLIHWLVTLQVLHPLNLLPRNSIVTLFPVLQEASNLSCPQSHLQFLLQCQAYPSFTNESSSHSTAQAILSPHLPPITTYGQQQLKKRQPVTFAIPNCSSVSEFGALANQGYQRGSNCGE
ncbi:hypothetical protein O181_068900 [Austropuccinia psidii MF-1]|uniref:Uncharacterized protein n=1 Tax=Austropuccinia psidii MF-1 TaxID=1389203 RepID=A0A9Q3ETF8_9BASI|nr:hypothetical protein [Austropuccinia psidii MF-1]